MRMNIYKLIATIAILTILPIQSCSDDNYETLHSILKEKSISQQTKDSIINTLQEDKSDIKSWTRLMQFYITTRKIDTLYITAQKAYDYGIKYHKDNLTAVSSFYLAQYFYWNGIKDSVKYYLNIANKHNGKTNYISGITKELEAEFLLNQEHDYPEAMDLYKEALTCYTNSNAIDEALYLNVKIASLYLLKKDTSSVQYAKEAYLLTKQTSSTYLQFIGNLIYAQSLGVKKEFDKGVEFSRKAIAIAENDSTLNPIISSAYSVTGEMLSGMGKKEEADLYFKKAIEALKYTGNMLPTLELYLIYGNFLLEEERYEEAKYYFETGLETAEKNGITRDKHLYLLGLSRTYAQLKNNEDALRYYQMYHKTFDSIFGAFTENEFNTLFSDYESVKLKNQLQSKEIEISRLYSALYIIGTVLTLALLAVTYSAYRRKDKMYTTMVEQHQQFIRQLSESKENEEKKLDAKNKTELELYNKMEDLMKNKKIYRMKDLSLEKLAEILGSNRTYVSAIINKFTNLTFYNYIHKYRINEAISIISNPEDDTAMKAICDDIGYNSLTSFYRAFQRETGCSPVIYRDRLRKIEKDKSRTTEEEI